MRFKMYKIKITQNEDVLTLSKLVNANELSEKFSELPLIKDDEEDEMQFTPMYSTYKCEIVLSTLVQEYEIKLKKFNKNQKKEQELPPDKNNDNTYFFINIEEEKIYIQNKRYPQESNLNVNKALDRLQLILVEALKDHQVSIQMIPITINYTVDDFENFFKNSIVKYIKASNLEGLEIPEGSVLHNPREDLDAALVESWNCYSKDTINVIEIKAKNDKKLNKNPFVKIAILLAKINKNTEILKKMEIIDDGYVEDIKPKGNSSKVIPISSAQQKDHIIVYDKILENTLKK